MIVIALQSLQVLNIYNINSKSKDNNLYQSNAKTDIPKTSQTRYVAKFKSKKKDLTSKNEFQNVQNKNQTANSTVFLSNKASFKYQVGYSNYNVYGAKNSDFHVTLANNTTHRVINIGTNLISAITVKVSALGQKWANLTITKNFTPTKDMIPASIHYLILGTKNTSDANVFLNMVYEKRTVPLTPITVKIGFFNVDNINANVGTVLSGGVIGGIVIGCVVTVIGFAISLHAALFDLCERKEIQSATSGIDAIITTAADKNELREIRFGRTTYGKEKVKIFPESNEAFIAESDTIIDKAERAGLLGNTGTEFTEQEKFSLKRKSHKDEITTARNKLVKARQAWLSAIDMEDSVSDQESAIRSNLGHTPPDSSSESSWKSSLEEKELSGNNNFALLAIDDPVLSLRNSGATNITKGVEETAAPVNPIKQTESDQGRKLAEKGVSDEKKRIAVLEEKKKKLG